MLDFRRSSEKAVTSLLNVAAPAADISKVNAVMAEPPSFPWKIMSLSDTIDLKVKLLLARFIFPSCVPADFNKISSPAASRVISPTASMIKSSVAVSVSASRVISSTTTPALAVTTPVEIIVPELVKLPTTSINVAVSSISSVAAISRTVALAPCMN